MTIVEIPPGSGNRYRYEYEEGATVYKGPVGDSPEMSEGEFLEMFRNTVNHYQMSGLTYFFSQFAEDDNAYINDYITSEQLKQLDLPIDCDTDCEDYLNRAADTIGDMVDLFNSDLIAGRSPKSPRDYYNELQVEF